MIPNPNIYTQDEGKISSNLLPVKKRTSIHLAWLKSLLSPTQWLTDLIFKNYADGSNYPQWLSGNYAYLDRVTYIDGAVYELQTLAGLTTSTPPNEDPANWLRLLNSFIGIREQARYSGQKLMLEYILNRRYLITPFSLIEWEIIWIAGVPTPQSTPPYTQIYITEYRNSITNFWLSNGAGLVSYMNGGSGPGSLNYLGNSYPPYSVLQFTIWVPLAVYTNIALIQPPGVTAEDAIRAIADKYIHAGAVYEIVSY